MRRAWKKQFLAIFGVGIKLLYVQSLHVFGFGLEKSKQAEGKKIHMKHVGPKSRRGHGWWGGSVSVKLRYLGVSPRGETIFGHYRAKNRAQSPQPSNSNFARKNALPLCYLAAVEGHEGDPVVLLEYTSPDHAERRRLRFQA